MGKDGKREKYESITEGWKEEDCLLGLSSHPVQRSYIYTSSDYSPPKCFMLSCDEFCKRNDLGSGFIKGVRERLHLKISFLSKWKWTHWQRCFCLLIDLHSIFKIFPELQRVCSLGFIQICISSFGIDYSEKYSNSLPTSLLDLSNDFTEGFMP